jgi:hypothetical protein
MSSSSVQINNFGGKKDRDQIQYPGNVLQFKTHQHLQAQIGNKARLPYPSPYSTSSTASSASSSGGEVINLSNNKNRTSGGSAYSPYSRSSGGGKSPKSTSSLSSSGGSTNGNGLFIGTTSILDNLLKNPRTHLEAAIAAAAAAAAHNAAANANNEANDNNDMVQYEAEGYLENCRSSPHNLTAAHLRQLQEQHGKAPYYCSPGSAGHPALVGANGGDDDNNNMEMTMTEDSTPIPAHLLEPNVEYHIGGSEYPDRYGTLHNPLADLAKVAAASMKHQPTTGGGNKRGSKKVKQEVDANGEITSTGRAGDSATPPAKPKPKKNEAIICDICSKKFSNAYNLRVC